MRAKRRDANDTLREEGPDVLLKAMDGAASVVDIASRRGDGSQGDAKELADVPWPTMDRAAYHGIIGKIVKGIAPHTEADPNAILVQLLVQFGNVIGRGPFY
jgi:hypothetical protein